MKKIITIAILAVYAVGCQWIISHPEIVPETEQIGEELFQDFEQYEHKTLSPTPPMNLGAKG
jgi:hypothetical protein